jgi:hypothetical protein
MAKPKDGSGPVDGPITKRLKAARGGRGWWPARDTDKPAKGGKHEGWPIRGRGKKEGR